ncbi:MAG: oligosaccharide flippase family protein [Leptolyngbyaceae cyanobacterium bins.59]|nr:oligosaccharide flippase family protein [Leptolyngbyaceae cyanobacterium bins.59]
MSIRTQVMKGGAYLIIRQGLGILIGLGGVLLLTRAIGPENYGLYAASFSLLVYLQSIAQWGIEVYLVRREGEEQIEVYHQAFTLLLCLGCGWALLSLLGLPLLKDWIRLEGFVPVARALFLGLPILVLGRVPMSRLERHLDYRKVALIEFGGQITYYTVALPLAFQGAGVWSAVAGWWAQQTLISCLLYWGARYRPRFYWDPKLIQEMIRYGLSFSTSMWVWQLRDLVNPLIIGRYAGAEAVGYVALAIRLIQTLSFVKDATWRLSIAALGRLQGNRTRLVKAVTEGMSLQVMALGPLLVGFAIVAPPLLPYLFGSHWLPVLSIYPFIALSYLTNAVFNLHSSVLYVLKKNWEVTTFHFIHIVLFAGAASLLVPHLGLAGYGWAEVIALPGYVVVHFWLGRNVGYPIYTQAGIWLLATMLPLFAWKLGAWAWGGLLLPIVWTKTRQEIQQALTVVLSRKPLS